MNIMRMFGTAVIETASLLAQAPIIIGETVCLIGRDTSKGVKKAAEFSENTFEKGRKGCNSARKSVVSLADDKKLVIKIRTAKTSEELVQALDEETAEAFQAEIKKDDKQDIHPTVILFYTRMDQLRKRESEAPEEEAFTPNDKALA